MKETELNRIVNALESISKQLQILNEKLELFTSNAGHALEVEIRE